MAFRDVMSSYINSLAPRGGAGRTTITGMGRDSGAKYRAMMAGMQEQARQKQQMERRLMPSTPMQQAPTQPVQQAPPVVAPPSGAAAPTAGGGPTNWQRAFPRMQGMGIGMIQGAQVSPYNRAPNWPQVWLEASKVQSSMDRQQTLGHLKEPKRIALPH